MNIAEITPVDLSNLIAQGYTEGDLAMLAKSEVDSLLVPLGDDIPESDPHAAAAAAQDAAAAAAAAASATATATAATPPAEQTPSTSIATPPTQYDVEVPADAPARLSALKLEENDAFKQLMDGVIDPDAYQVIKDRVEQQSDEIKTALMQARIFEQANQQAVVKAAQNEWARSEATAMAAFKEQGLDYKAKPALLAAYNTNLKMLGVDPANDNRDAAWFLSEANRLTREDLGLGAAITKQGAKNHPAPTRSGVDVSELPPTLRSVPVAATGAIGADEFSHMRNLTGLAMEKAHAMLTPAQRERWMAE